MFLPWTLFFVNLILLTAQFLVVAAIGAILAIYSRLRGEHANSIRWIRQGGYLEMFSFLVNTRKEITIQAKTALLFTIIATLTADIAGRGVVHFIEPTTRQANSSFFNVTTKQYMPTYIGGASISGWSSTIYRGANITNAMVSMINDTKITKVIPDAIDGRVYTPRTFDYGVGCDNIDVTVDMDANYYVLSDAGCARAVLFTFGDESFNDTGEIITKRSNNQWSLSWPVNYLDDVEELLAVLRVSYNNTKCYISDLASSIMDAPRDGLTSLPFTQTTKCVYPSGDVTSISLSTIRFMATTVPQFSNISRMTFDEYDELFQAMEVTLSKNNNTSGNSTFYTEIKSEGSTITLLSCLVAPSPLANNTAYPTCMYVIADIIILERQDVNPIIAAARGEAPQPDPPLRTTTFAFSHMPSTEDGLSQTSIAEVKKTNAATTSYLASLGQNLYVDWNRQQVTIIFDTTDAEDGLEIPRWLIICVPIVAVISGLLLGSTEYFLDVRYTSSLYKAITLPMRSRMNRFAPMLMRSKVSPMEFEGIPVVPSDHRFTADPNSVATLQSDNNSSITLVNEKYSSNKLNQF